MVGQRHPQEHLLARRSLSVGVDPRRRVDNAHASRSFLFLVASKDLLIASLLLVASKTTPSSFLLQVKRFPVKRFPRKLLAARGDEWGR